MVIRPSPGGEPLWRVSDDLANLFQRSKQSKHKAASGSRELSNVISLPFVFRMVPMRPVEVRTAGFPCNLWTSYKSYEQQTHIR
jgi:hypothetical protein